MTSLDKFLKDKHPEVLEEYKQLVKDEENAMALDTTIPDLFDGKWTDQQQNVITVICSARDRPCEYISWSNWKECPYFGDLIHDGPLDPHRYETIYNDEMLSRILPIEDEFCDEWFEKHKLTVGQVNEILMWWWKTADTSVTWDW